MSSDEKNQRQKRELPLPRPEREFYMPAMPPFWLCRAVARAARRLYRYFK
jgi:hypothetical protein